MRLVSSMAMVAALLLPALGAAAELPALGLWRSRGAGGELVTRDGPVDVHVTPHGLTLRVSSSSGRELLDWSVRGARATTPVPSRKQEAVVHDLRGPTVEHRPGLPTFGRAELPGVLPGVDVRFDLKPRGTEWTLLLAPGVAPESVRLQWKGPSSVERVGAGLELRTAGGMLAESAPRCRQPAPGGDREVPCRFSEVRPTGPAQWEYAVEAPTRDPALPLVIDPTVTWGRVGGGAADDELTGVAVDDSGNVFVSGTTTSTDFIGKNRTDTSKDALLLKLTPGGATLVWMAMVGGTNYVGGSDADYGRGVAALGPNNILLLGDTASAGLGQGTVFQPTKAGAAGTTDCFLASFLADGTLDKFGYFGGAGNETCRAISAGSGPAVSVAFTGTTYSATLPDRGGATINTAATSTSSDVFVADALGILSALMWTTAIGGPGDETAGTVVRANSRTIAVGTTTSSSGFPTVSGFNGKYGGGTSDAYVVELDSSGAVVNASLLGGNGADIGRAAAFDSSGNVYVGGSTVSTSGPFADFPKKSAVDGMANGLEGFITRIDKSGKTVGWSTYLGGLDDESVESLAVSGQRLFVFGGVKPFLGSSPGSDLPGLTLDKSLDGSSDAFFAVMGLDGTLGWSTYLGGTGAEDPAGLTLDENGLGLVCGATTSTDFPGAQSGPPAGRNGFIARMLDDGTPPGPGSVSDGAAADVDVQSVDDPLSASWTGFDDPESTVTFEWAIGTTKGGEELQPFTSVGPDTSATYTGTATTAGTWYVTVRAMNGSGLTTTATSDGVTRLAPDAGTADADGGDGGTGGDDGGAGDAAGLADAAGMADGGSDGSISSGGDAGTDAGMEALADAGTMPASDAAESPNEGPADAATQDTLQPALGWSCGVADGGALGGWPLVLLAAGLFARRRR